MNKQEPSNVIRVESIDYLRGLAAFSVMAYHMVMFTYGEVSASSIFAKFKIYGVSIFYILSGITLYIVYINRLKFTKSNLLGFYVKRFFRLVPLLWLATILTLAFQFTPDMVSIKKIILNSTVILGAIRPDAFIASGAWSIGNEIFFYLFFPLIIFACRKNTIYLFIILSTFFVVLLYFAFEYLDPKVPLGQQWSKYVNPLGQIFYFVLGITIGKLSGYLEKNNKMFLSVLILTCILFYIYTAPGEPIALVTGWARVVLSFYTLLICVSFYKIEFDGVVSWFRNILQFLGDISYSLYLLHPIVYFLIKSLLNKMDLDSSILLISSTVIFAPLAAFLSYNYFEKYFINVGKKLYEKIQAKL